ncbi:hypothetical protein [Sideroxydans sp. CL21]|nr:hypothetical protein [Sideroxydans sp. CL21]
MCKYAGNSGLRDWIACQTENLVIGIYKDGENDSTPVYFY